MRVAVLGGGISGLTAAYRLHQLSPEIQLQLYDAADRLGGVLCSRCRDGTVSEFGADSFLANAQHPHARDLCEELAMTDQLITTCSENRGALVAFRGKLHPIPAGFQLLRPGDWRSLLFSGLLSPIAKLRILAERWVPPRADNVEESLAQFATRRLGREAFERLVEPLAAGIFTADANRLSIDAALPQFVEQEKRYGSLTRAVLSSANQSSDRGARYSQFLSLREGIQGLTDRLCAKLPSGTVQIGQAIRGITRDRDRTWQVHLDGGDQMEFDAILSAVPAPVAASLLEHAHAGLSHELGSIAYASSAVVHLTYASEQLSQPPRAFGFVVPRTENSPFLAGSFSSVKFAHRAAPGEIAIRGFLGGAMHPEILEQDDAALVDLTHRGLSQLLKIHGSPRAREVHRWKQCMPQYHLGHLARVARIEALVQALPHFELTGNFLRGVGIPQCIASADASARRLIQSLVPPADDG